jgi:hypothetical protein
MADKRSFFLMGLLVCVIGIAGVVPAYAAETPNVSAGSEIGAVPPTDASSDPDGQASLGRFSGIFNVGSLAKLAKALNPQAEILPVQVASVRGDQHKFEAMNWLNRGYSGGFKDVSAHYQAADDITVEMSGRAIAGNNDYRGDIAITKKDFGYLNFDFKQFRKYYDTYGGIYKGWATSLNRDLFLDIGKFGVELGITVPDFPQLSVFYEHEYKDGAKSKTSWASAYSGSGVTGDQRKVAPAWMEVDEVVDIFGIKGDYETKGYHLTGEQKWEIDTVKTHDYQQTLSMVSGRGGQIEYRQNSTIDAVAMTTMAGADKWYLSDKVFASSAYRFMHLKNNQVHNLLQFTDNRLTSASNPKNDGHNDQNVNSWVANVMAAPWNWLEGTSGFKAEFNTRDGDSYLQSGTSASNLKGGSTSDTGKFAEEIGVRFKAIPRTALYSDLSFEQSRNHLNVSRIQVDPTTAYAAISRDAVIYEPAITWTTGGDLQPVRFLNLTSQIQLRDKKMEFHDSTIRSTPKSGQVFLEYLHTQTLRFTERATWRLASWAKTSFRYLYDDTQYTTRAAYEVLTRDARMHSHTFVYDVNVFPLPELSMTGALSQQLAETETVTSTSTFATLPTIPAFTSNYYSCTFSTDYQPHEKVKLDSSLFYTFATNGGNGQSNTLVNYASEYDHYGITVGVKWQIRKDLTVEPQYSYTSYLPSTDSGIGGAYTAQVVGVTLTTNWG